MITSIFSIVASIAGIFATYWIGKKITIWLQAYRDMRQAAEELRVKQESEIMARKAQSDSDELKDIERR